MYQTIGVYNNSFPPEGPKIIEKNITFAGAENQSFDFVLEMERNKITRFQGLFFNNVAGPDCTLICPVTNQEIKLLAGKQGTVVLLVSGSPKFEIQAAGPGTVRMHFVNFPVNTAIY
jgi:hypothetical protein